MRSLFTIYLLCSLLFLCGIHCAAMRSLFHLAAPVFMAFPALARVGRFSSGLLSSSLAGLVLSVPG